MNRTCTICSRMTKWWSNSDWETDRQKRQYRRTPWRSWKSRPPTEIGLHQALHSSNTTADHEKHILIHVGARIITKLKREVYMMETCVRSQARRETCQCNMHIFPSPHQSPNQIWNIIKLKKHKYELTNASHNLQFTIIQLNSSHESDCIYIGLTSNQVLLSKSNCIFRISIIHTKQDSLFCHDSAFSPSLLFTHKLHYSRKLTNSNLI